MQQSARDVHEHAPAQARPAEQPAQWRSEELLEGSKEAIIVHGDAQYRLRITRHNKLILYK